MKTPLKRIFKTIGVILGLSSVVLAAPSSPPAGNYITNISTNASNQIFSVSSGTVVGQLTVGNCVLSNGGSCGGGGGGASGQINNASQYSAGYYSVTGSSNVISGIAPSAGIKVLTSSGTAGPPYWANPSGGAGSFTGLNASGQPNLASSATLVAGNNITLSQSGSSVTITAASGSGGTSVNISTQTAVPYYSVAGSSNVLSGDYQNFSYNSAKQTVTISTLAVSSMTVGGQLNLTKTVIPAGGSTAYTDSLQWDVIASTAVPGDIVIEKMNVVLSTNPGFSSSFGIYVSTSNANTAVLSMTPTATSLGAGGYQFLSGPTQAELLGNLGNSQLGVDATGAFALVPATFSILGSGSLPGGLGLRSGGNTTRTVLRGATGSPGADIPLTFPNSQGGASTYLQNDGAGNLSWTTVSGGSGSGVVVPSTFTWGLVNGSTFTATYVTASTVAATSELVVGVSTRIAGQVALGQGPDSSVVSTTSVSTLWASTSSGTLVFTDGTSSTATVVGSTSTPTIGHLAAWSAQGRLIDGGTGGGGGGTPGGSTMQVQYNNAGSFAGNSGFQYNGSSVTMLVPLVVASTAQANIVSFTTAPGGNYGMFVSSTLPHLASDYIVQYASPTASGPTLLGVQLSGHIVSSGTTPSMGTCGTSPSVVGTDSAGLITVGSGVVTSCAMNFANPYTNPPVCTESDNSTSVTASITSITTSSITFGFSATLGGGNVWYICVGNKG